DQGGECELQDLSMGYGSSHSEYDECKRSIADENLGPLISTEMTRCIYCTRCVRFGSEVAGMRELGGTYRGEHTEIGTFVRHAMHSEVSGNIIDLCPVGALTSKPYRFTARAWELEQAPSIAPHDCIGTNVYVHTRYGKVKRVVPRENGAINQTWLSDRDRYSYTGLYHADRLAEPMARIDGAWRAVEWQKAFEMITTKLQSIIAEQGADQIGALASPNSTTEEFYLLQKIMRGLGSHNIDHRLREIDHADQANIGLFPGLSFNFAELAQANAIILIGSNIQKEQPLAALRVREASLKGALVAAINPVDYDFNFAVHHKIISANLPQAAAALATNKSEAKSILESLAGKQKVYVLLGAHALNHPQASIIRSLANQFAASVNAKVGLLTEGANAAGAWLAGAIPHRHAASAEIKEAGLNAYQMLAKPRQAYLLMNVEPEFDCANAAQAIAAIKEAKFVAALSLYRNAVLEEHADIILPMAAFTETSGTFVNAAGEWQSFTGVAAPYQSSRPAWKILRVLGNFLHLEGFGYESSEEVKHELKHLLEKAPAFTACTASQITWDDQAPKLSRIGEIPIYAKDSLVRRALPLQEAQRIMEGNVAAVRLHPDTAKTLNLHDGDEAKVKQDHAEVTLKVLCDARIAKDSAWIAGGIKETTRLGDLYGSVEVTKIS
ncbi:MAG: molybdopterin-dependent oxidoreductase, partial [Gammaproteobacteria bacterium]|nr:molybdopterin-dependent oxidoreductase [Gammaproteobacteria bacterium]